MNLERLMETVEWSQPIHLNTKRGPRLLKKAPIEKAFWAIYRENPEGFKSAFREAGISMTKFREVWELAWWSGEDMRFKSLPEMRQEAEPEISITDLPALKFPDGLLEFQLTSVQLGVRSMQKYNRVLLGHATGVGKTYCALGIARELGKRVAVIAPKAILTDWHRAAKHMKVETYDVAGWEWVKTSKSKIGKWADSKKSRFQYELPDDVVLVFDEVHRGKSPGQSQNSFLVRDAVEQNIPSIALSATIADDPTKLWAMGQFLGLHSGGRDFYRFIQGHGCSKTNYGFQFQGHNNILKKLHHRIYPDRGNRLRHSDLGDAFPETLIHARAFDMDAAKDIANEYDELCARIEELRMQENFTVNALAAQTHARQRIELMKAGAVASLARDYIEEGCSVFIAVNYTETRLFLMEELKTKCAIYGGQSDLERRGCIDSFQNDKSRVIIGIVQACREGLNLHDTNGKHQRVALIMPTPSPYDLKQVLGRVHRAGGKSRSCQFIVYAAGVPIEEDICRKLDGKLKRMDLLNDAAVDPSVNLAIPEDDKEKLDTKLI